MPEQSHTNRIRCLSEIFRAAIEAAVCKHQSRLPITLQGFPSGACGDAALLLAKFLEQHGEGAFDYMLGVRAGWSHAWLQRGALIVDITADQFDDMAEPVVVAEVSDWHALFDGASQGLADFTGWDAHTRMEFTATYACVLTSVPEYLRPVLDLQNRGEDR